MGKVLFLDIDGVLLCNAEYRRGNVRAQFPGERVGLVIEVCRRAGAVVVVSSAWRYSEETRAVLALHDVPLHPDWHTPRPNLGEAPDLRDGVRGHEIKHWLAAHPEVGAYAIVDDDSDMLREQMPWFAKTNFEDGLTRDHADALVDMLNTPRTPPTTEGA